MPQSYYKVLQNWLTELHQGQHSENSCSHLNKCLWNNIHLNIISRTMLQLSDGAFGQMAISAVGLVKNNILWRFSPLFTILLPTTNKCVLLLLLCVCVCACARTHAHTVQVYISKHIHVCVCVCDCMSMCTATCVHRGQARH